MNLKPYEVRTTNSWRPLFADRIVWVQYKNVPMEKLTTTKRLLKSKGLKFRIRYRGPRCSVFDTRPASSRRQDCLKRFANRFTVYILN